MKPEFTGGANVALKIPRYKYEETVAFYRDTLGLTVEELPTNDHPTVSKTCKVQFGPLTLWLDCIDTCTHSEVWLEVQTADVESATRYLGEHGCTTKDEFEKLPGNCHWITDPSGTVMILKQKR